MLCPFFLCPGLHFLSDLFIVVVMERSVLDFPLLLDRTCLYIIHGFDGSCGSLMISYFACIALAFGWRRLAATYYKAVRTDDNQLDILHAEIALIASYM